MSSSGPSDEAFLERALRYQDGTLSPEDTAALEQEMLASEDKRRAFAEMQMQSMLLNEALRREAYSAGSDSRVRSPAVTRSHRRKLVRVLAWAIPAAAAAAIVWFISTVSWLPDFNRHQPNEVSLAAITYDQSAEWEDGRAPSAAGTLSGGAYSLASGTVRLTFAHDETIATLAGPTRFDLVAPGHIRLHEGRLSARVSQPDKGFTVHTDALTVLDRGTVFGVDVEPDGEAHVSVLEGKVDVAEPGSQTMQRIEQGGRVSARPKGRRVTQAADDARSGFEDLWPLTLGVDNLSHLVEFVVPRARHKWQDYRSDSRLYLMPERQRVQPAGPLSVDILPGVPLDFKKKDPQPHLLTYNGRVNSYLLFFRPLEDARERRPAIRGSITFAQPVLGIISNSVRLQETDDTLGHRRVAYRDKPRRGIENWRKPAERDVVSISKDGRRLFFNLHATTDPDEFRVLVAAP
jgi:ferric-dicitrate binding protein FerR (iron transport regulator)